MELRVEPAALTDFFGNRPGAAYVHAFAWPAGDAVLDDTAAPRVEAVRLHGRAVEIELSEEPDLASMTAAVSAAGQSLTWSLAADGYTVRSAVPYRCQPLFRPGHRIFASMRSSAP